MSKSHFSVKRWAKLMVVGSLVLSSSAISQLRASATVVDTQDTAFGAAATAALRAGFPLNSIAATPDGKWIVATDGGLVRLNVDGTKDTSYLGNYDVSGSNNDRFVTAMDVDSQGGAIVSSGFWSGGIGRRMPDGSVDANFAIELTNNGPYLSSAPKFIKVLTNGDILMAGRFDETNAFGSAALLKMTATGENIATFNNNVGNYLLGSSLASPPEVEDVEIDSQGRILMAIQPYASDFGALVRFNADGTPDGTFNQNVSAWLGDAGSPSNARGMDVEVLPGGGYLIAGEFSGSAPPRADILTPGHPWGGDCWDVTLFRVNESGASDTAFNGTYDSSGLCGARTVAGGIFPTEIGFPNLKQYTGVVADDGVTTGRFVGPASSVDVDALGNILIGGKFNTDAGNSVVSSGLIRLSATGTVTSVADEVSSNWTGWNPDKTILKSLSPSGETLLAFSRFNGAAIRKYSGNPVPAVTPLSQTVSGTAGIPITASTVFTPSNFAGAVSYAVTTGVLPSGLSLSSSTGVVSGTPTAASTATVAITATGASAGTAIATITFAIAAAPAVTPATQTVSGTAGTAITPSTAFTASNFTGAVSYAVTSGTLPAGLSLSSSTGVVSGTPTAASTATVTVTATGATAGTATATITFAIAAAAVAPTTTTAATTTIAPTTTTTPGTGPQLVTSANQALLTAEPGKATALVNGVAVTPQIVSASNSAAAQTEPAERSEAQVRELQQAAAAIETRLDTIAGGDSGVSVVRTDTGAAMTGIFDGVRVPVEDVVVVNAADTATLFAARDVRGNIVEVKPGAVLEVAANGDVAVQAYGLRSGEEVELVVMSTPTLLGKFTVDANGTIKTTAKLPTAIGAGNHTLVVASKSVKASLGLKLVKSTASLPATGSSSNELTNWALMALLSGAFMTLLTRSRRRLNVK